MKARNMLLALSTLCAPAAAQTLTTYLPENAVYRYVNATAATDIGSVPPTWFLESFDDSAWFVGAGAFGTGFGPDAANAHGPGTPDAAQFPGGTAWSANRDPYLRARFTLPAAVPLTIWFAVDNGVQNIALNGIQTTISFNAEGDARRWEHVVDVPAAFVRPGENLISLQLEDHGALTGFAMVITSDDPLIQPPFSVDPGVGYCFGIGCPCANDDPNGGCANSTGRGAGLRAAGTARVAQDDLVLVMSNLPSSTFGVLYMGPAAASVPFGNGLRCVSPGPPGVPPGVGFFRFPVRHAVGGGIIEGPGLVAHASTNFGAPGTILVGSTWRFQGYYRDATASCVSTFNLTNGVAVTFL